VNFAEWKVDLRCTAHLVQTQDNVKETKSTQAETKPEPREKKQSPNAPLKVYLAGRISKCDWRHKLVLHLGNNIDGGVEGWREVKELPMIDGNTYVGPFFVGCDHGCYHGANRHGASGGVCYSSDVTKREIFNKALGELSPAICFSFGRERISAKHTARSLRLVLPVGWERKLCLLLIPS
jgi:hypothetical protein